MFLKIIFAVVLGFSLWYGWNHIKPNHFPIKNIKIFATYEHLDQTVLQKTIASYLNQGFFYLNVIGMKQQLLQLPWIHTVVIGRKWPDTVMINITEQKAILQWGNNGLVNPEGVIFFPAITTFPAGLPIILGPEDRKLEIFVLYQKIKNLFEPLDLSIKKLVLDPEHYWQLLLSNDTAVYLKEAEPINQLELLVNLYRKITADHNEEPKSIDLRYNSGLAVKWR